MQGSANRAVDEHVLGLARRHVPGTGEPEVAGLQSGVANSSYSVIRSGSRYAMRIANADSSLLGLDRDWECRVLQQVARARLAPVVEVCLPAEGVLVTRWVEGICWSAAQARQLDTIAPVAGLIRKIHSVRAPVLARAMTPARWIDLYRNALIQHALAPVLEAQVPPRQKAYERCGPKAATLCHSDLHRHNLIQSGKEIVVLDWEYAHVGDPFWDLAGWLSMNDLSGDAAETLLTAYLARSPLEDERRRLRILQWFYDYVGLLWIRLYEAVRTGDAPGAAAPGDLIERAGVLQSRLEAAVSSRL
jgi:thiamine kinase